VVYDAFTIDLETGVGLTMGQGRSPEVILQWSDDAGHTWSNEHRVDVGAIGEYDHRAVWRRLGRSRARVFRVVVSDPVKWAFVDAYLGVRKGFEGG
jgi:hypothetical protein